MVNSTDTLSYSSYSQLGREVAWAESITERGMAEKGLELGEVPQEDSSDQ